MGRRKRGGARGRCGTGTGTRCTSPRARDERARNRVLGTADQLVKPLCSSLPASRAGMPTARSASRKATLIPVQLAYPKACVRPQLSRTRGHPRHATRRGDNKKVALIQVHHAFPNACAPGRAPMWRLSAAVYVQCNTREAARATTKAPVALLWELIAQTGVPTRTMVPTRVLKGSKTRGVCSLLKTMGAGVRADHTLTPGVV